jgi:hypothetical protein
MLLCTLWLTFQPTLSSCFDKDWQFPLFASIPVAMSFGGEDVCISTYVVLCKLAIGVCACMTAFGVCSLTWFARSDTIQQSIVLCLLQPLASVFFVFMQRHIPTLKHRIQNTHLLEVQVVFQSTLYGLTSSDSFTVWKMPVYVLASYSIGVFFIFVVVLFVAPRWSCTPKELEEIGDTSTMTIPEQAKSTTNTTAELEPRVS